jgi:menaquinone-specific isochorismate synthase
MTGASDTAVDGLRRALEALRDAPLTAGDGHPSFLRATAPAGEVDLIDWLAASSDPTRVYWENRDATAAVAGIGATDIIKGSPSDCSKRFQQLYGHTRAIDPSIRYYGGMGFFKAVRAAHWQAFGDCSFILPNFELSRRQSDITIGCNLLVRSETERDQMIDQAQAQIEGWAWPADSADRSLPRIEGSRHLPERAVWMKQVERALDMIDHGDVQKVVLAGTEQYTFAAAIDPTTILRRLAATSPACIHFMIQVDAEHAFVGATPERLYRRHGRCVESEALAGTRARGMTEEEDSRLAAELLDSEKEQREHQFVLNALLQTLHPLTDQLTHTAEVSVLKLDRVQHLYQMISGELSGRVMDDDIIRALHPTAAVGGVPRIEAMKVIAATEQTDRGWYASPIGWLSRDAAEFAVGIRSGLVAGRELILYAGAGIVRGSEPAAEWDEIGHKLQSFAQVVHNEQ